MTSRLRTTLNGNVVVDDGPDIRGRTIEANSRKERGSMADKIAAQSSLCVSMGIWDAEERTRKARKLSEQQSQSDRLDALNAQDRKLREDMAAMSRRTDKTVHDTAWLRWEMSVQTEVDRKVEMAMSEYRGMSKTDALAHVFREDPQLYKRAQAEVPVPKPQGLSPRELELTADQARDALQRKGDAIKKGNPALTKEQALSQAFSENSALYRIMRGGGQQLAEQQYSEAGAEWRKKQKRLSDREAAFSGRGETFKIPPIPKDITPPVLPGMTEEEAIERLKAIARNIMHGKGPDAEADAWKRACEMMPDYAMRAAGKA